jgi:phage terminase small subunit
LIDLNATAAYKRAGYKGTGRAAENAASRLLNTPAVANAIAAAIQARAARLEVSADNVLRELAIVGFSDLSEVLDFSGEAVKLKPANQITEAGRRLLASLKVQRVIKGKGANAREVEVTDFKLWDKLAALTALGKHLGLFPNKVEHSGIGGKPIPIQIVGIEVVPPAAAAEAVAGIAIEDHGGSKSG